MSEALPLCLIDTNVLIRFADAADPLHSSARKAVIEVRSSYRPQVAAQNLVECWNVMTRPRERNGFGQTIAQAHQHLLWIEQLFPRVAEPPDAYERWRALVVAFAVSGVQVHDARLVSLMLSLGISSILTFNAQDFARYSSLGIRVLSPAIS
jgi:predicted nucleic acid-binding protein